MRTTAPQRTPTGQARSAIAPRTGQYVQVPNRAELAPLGLQAEDIHQSESKLGSSASEASEHHDSSEALRLSYNFGQIPIFSAIASSAKENLVSPVLDATYTSKEDCRTRRLQLNAIATSATLIDTASMQSGAGVRWPVARHNRSDGIPYRAHMERVFGADFSTVQSIRGESDLLTSRRACRRMARNSRFCFRNAPSARGCPRACPHPAIPQRAARLDGAGRNSYAR